MGDAVVSKYDDDGQPIKQSRWVENSDVERYTKEQQKDLAKYREADGWNNGARVRRVRAA